MSFIDPDPKSQALPVWRDRLGICLSFLCLAHCLLTPFVIGLLPAGIAMGFWHEGFHRFFLMVVPLVALLAFIPGWRIHRDSRVWFWGIVGFVLLASGVVFEEHGALPTILGGICLIRAHWLNRKLCACCAHEHRSEK